MQRKAYVTGVAALLAALLAGCTGGSDDGGSDDNSKSGQAGTVTAPAQPGKYATLPEPCGAVPRGTLDALLPGVRQLPDQQQREAAYDGSPALTFDTDRKVGCRWKVESSDATDHLSVDFERVVSYANAVSDDAQAEQLFAEERDAADLPEPAPSGTGGGTPSASVSTSPPVPPPPRRAAHRPPRPRHRVPPPTSSPARWTTSVTRRSSTTSSAARVRRRNSARSLWRSARPTSS